MESESSLIEVVLANIGKTTYGSATFLIPTETPQGNLSNYRVVYDSSLSRYHIVTRQVPQWKYTYQMPSYAPMGVEFKLDKGNINENIGLPGRPSLISDDEISNTNPYEATEVFCNNLDHLDVAPTTASTQSAVEPANKPDPSETSWMTIASSECECSNGPSWADIVEEDIYSTARQEHSLPSKESTVSIIPEYYNSVCGIEWADMVEDEQSVSGVTSPAVSQITSSTDDEPLSPTTPVSPCSGCLEETRIKADISYEDLSSQLNALCVTGFPTQYEEYDASQHDWHKRWNETALTRGLNLQMRGPLNYRTYEKYVHDYLNCRHTAWDFMDQRTQDTAVKAKSVKSKEVDVSEDSSTEYDADCSDAGILDNGGFDCEHCLPNLRQYVPEDTSADFQATLDSFAPEVRDSPISKQLAQGMIDWYYICQASKNLLASGTGIRKALEETDRSMDWLWDTVNQNGTKAFYHCGYSEAQPQLTAPLTIPDPQAIHHYNFCGSPVSVKSATPPAVSMWFASSPGVADHANKTVISLQKQVLMSQAARYLDPFSYDGPEVIDFMQGTSLQEFATGLAKKVYTPDGTWMTDHFGMDEDQPQCSTYASSWFDSSNDTLNHPIQPYVISASNDGDTVINDGQSLHPMSISKTRASVGAKSSLQYVQAIDDAVSESITTSQSPAALLLNDCQAVIAQLILAGNTTEKTNSKIVTSFGKWDIAACLKSGLNPTAIEVGSILNELNILLDREEKHHLNKAYGVLKGRLGRLIDPSSQLTDHAEVVEDATNASAETVEWSTTSTIGVRLPPENIQPVATECIDNTTKTIALSDINQLCQAQDHVCVAQHINVGMGIQGTEAVEGTTNVQMAIGEAVVVDENDFVPIPASDDCGSPSVPDLFLYDEGLANEDPNEGSVKHSSDNVVLEEMDLDESVGKPEVKIFRQSWHQELRQKALAPEGYAASTDNDLLEALSDNPEFLASAHNMNNFLHGVEDESSLNISKYKRPGFIHEDDSLEGISFFSTQTKQGLECWLNKGDSEDEVLSMPVANADEDLEELQAKTSQYQRPQAALELRSRHVFQYKDDSDDNLSAAKEEFEDSGMDSDEYSPDNSGIIIDCWPDSEDEEQRLSSDICIKVVNIENVVNSMAATVGSSKARKGGDGCSKQHGRSVKHRHNVLDSMRDELKNSHQINSPDTHDIMLPHFTNGIEEDQIVCIAADKLLPRSAIPVLPSPQVTTRENVLTKVEFLKALIPDACIPEVEIPVLLLPPPIFPTVSRSDRLAFRDTRSSIVMPEANLQALKTLESKVVNQDAQQQDVLNAQRIATTKTTTTEFSPPLVTAQYPDLSVSAVPTRVTSGSSTIAIDPVIIGDDEFADDSEVENCALSSDEVDIKERAWMLENPDYLQVDHSAAEEDVPKHGKYCGVDFNLLDVGNSIPAKTQAVSEEPNAGRKELIKQLILLPAEDEDKLRHKEPIVEVGEAEEQRMEVSGPSNKEVDRPFSATDTGSKISGNSQPTAFDCRDLLDFLIPRPKLGNCLLYGSIAFYLGHRIYSAFRL